MVDEDEVTSDGRCLHAVFVAITLFASIFIFFCAGGKGVTALAAIAPLAVDVGSEGVTALAAIVLALRRLKQPCLEDHVHDVVMRPLLSFALHVHCFGRDVVFRLVVFGGCRCVTAPAAAIGTWLRS